MFAYLHLAMQQARVEHVDVRHQANLAVWRGGYGTG